MDRTTARCKTTLDGLAGRTVELTMTYSHDTGVDYLGEVVETGLTNRNDEIVVLRMASGRQQTIFLDDIARVHAPDVAAFDRAAV